MMGLTKRQSELLEFLRTHLFAHGRSPTYHEIAIAMGWASRSIVFHAVRALEARGFITITPDVAHGIELVETIGHDPRDCFCDGCNAVRIRAHQTFIQALSEPAPILAGSNFKALGHLSRLCWRAGFPKPAHPETRKPQSNVQPAQVGQ